VSAEDENISAELRVNAGTEPKRIKEPIKRGRAQNEGLCKTVESLRDEIKIIRSREKSPDHPPRPEALEMPITTISSLRAISPSRTRTEAEIDSVESESKMTIEELLSLKMEYESSDETGCFV